MTKEVSFWFNLVQQPWKGLCTHFNQVGNNILVFQLEPPLMDIKKDLMLYHIPQLFTPIVKKLVSPKAMLYS